MQAGTYYVGDLCYVLHPEWTDFCGITIQGNEVLDGEFNLPDGRRFATYSTAYGDGVYPASNGASLGVDAGLIGCIRVEDISEQELPNLVQGTVVEFDEPFSTHSQEGVIHFGDLIVDTN